jgi:hypothetical protein
MNLNQVGLYMDPEKNALQKTGKVKNYEGHEHVYMD